MAGYVSHLVRLEFGFKKLLQFIFIYFLMQNDTVYKCRVYDDREIVVNRTRRLVTEIEIPVYVAEKFSDTCSEAPADGIEWPRTKKVVFIVTRNVLMCIFLNTI